jgi:hypothetical protein
MELVCLILFFVTISTTVSWFRRQRLEQYEPEKVAPPKPEAPKPAAPGWLDTNDRHLVFICAGIKCENLPPLHSLERLRWHRAKGDITTENLQMGMWLLHPEWMRLMEKENERRATRH